MNKSPIISIIIPTYNRADTLNRALDSILKQTFGGFEIIVVNDGSTDNTYEILKNYSDTRIKVISHTKNKGVTAAINTGFNSMNGEWFTLLGSDDEILPAAFETFLRVPQQIDPSINAISCNCIDTTTKKFSGTGLDKDQYLDEQTIVAKCSGEFWGLTKSSLLSELRLNEHLPGFENTLWYKINSKANRFYIHKCLRIYHTEGEDRISKDQFKKKYISQNYQYKLYKELKNELFYLNKLKMFAPGKSLRISFNGLLTSKSKKDFETARFYFNFLRNNENGSYSLSFEPFIYRRGNEILF